MFACNNVSKTLLFMVLVMCSLYTITSFSSESVAASDSGTRYEHNDINAWYFLTFENDVLSFWDDSDDGYTNGIGFAWGYEGYNSFNTIDMPDWIRLSLTRPILMQAMENVMILVTA